MAPYTGCYPRDEGYGGTSTCVCRGLLCSACCITSVLASRFVTNWTDVHHKAVISWINLLRKYFFKYFSKLRQVLKRFLIYVPEIF